MGWDGQIRPPDANEVGWKESVRMNPLEDIYLALRPVRQNLPWPLPDMWRPIDVTKPLGANTDFTGVDINNNPIPVVNDVANFGWEYVWHCHLLGHEDNDMLRGEVFVVAPEAPSGLAVTSVGPPVALGFTDNSKSALTFGIERSTTASFDPGTVATLSTVSPGVGPQTVTFSDSGAAPGTTYFYRVRAEKVLTSPAIPGMTYPAVSGWSNAVSAFMPPPLRISPSPIAFGNVQVGTPVTLPVTVTNIGAAPFTVTGVGFSGTNQADFSQTNNCGTIAGGLDLHRQRDVHAGRDGREQREPRRGERVHPERVPLNGSGQSAISITPGTLSFPIQQVGTTSGGKQFTVSNVGSAAFTVTSVTTIGTNPGDYTQTNTCGAVAPGGSCTVTVRFAPTATGPRTATVTVQTSEPGQPSVSAPITGTGIAVMLTPSLASPQAPGTAVVFTTQLQGATAYQYRFFLSTDNGTTWTQVQGWSSSNRRTLNSATVAQYRVLADTRTVANGPVDAQSTATFTYKYPPATGVTITTQPASSPQPAGTPVTFIAQGQGSSNYWYRFFLEKDNGTTWTEVQPWSQNASWPLPGTTPAGNYRVLVYVRTNPTGGPDAQATAKFSLF